MSERIDELLAKTPLPAFNNTKSFEIIPRALLNTEVTQQLAESPSKYLELLREGIERDNSYEVLQWKLRARGRSLREQLGLWLDTLLEIENVSKSNPMSTIVECDNLLALPLPLPLTLVNEMPPVLYLGANVHLECDHSEVVNLLYDRCDLELSNLKQVIYDLDYLGDQQLINQLMLSRLYIVKHHRDLMRTMLDFKKNS